MNGSDLMCPFFDSKSNSSEVDIALATVMRFLNTIDLDTIRNSSLNYVLPDGGTMASPFDS
jgi:hypothetical protein